jgi:hypothetical protein
VLAAILPIGLDFLVNRVRSIALQRGQPTEDEHAACRGEGFLRRLAG